MSARTACISGCLAAGLLAAASIWPASAAESSGPIPDFMTGAWGLDNPGDPTAYFKIPGDPGPGPIMQHPDYPYDNDTRYGVRRMADTTHPALQPWVKAQMDAAIAPVLEGARTGSSEGIAFVPTSRCWPGGVPGTHLYTGEVYYLQTPGEVWIHQTRDAVRRIYLNREHSENPPYSWFGESVGHYENGDTLVIDTIALDDKGPIDRLNTPHTKQLHVVERHKIVNVDGEKRMHVTFTVEDPGVFTMPFSGMVELAHSDAAWNEFICNENSRDYHIPDENMMPAPSDSAPDF